MARAPTLVSTLPLFLFLLPLMTSACSWCIERNKARAVTNAAYGGGAALVRVFG